MILVPQGQCAAECSSESRRRDEPKGPWTPARRDPAGAWVWLPSKHGWKPPGSSGWYRVVSTTFGRREEEHVAEGADALVPVG